MGLINRAYRNLWRKKARSILVIISLTLVVATILSVYTGVAASQENTEDMIEKYEATLNAMEDLNEAQNVMITVSAAGRGSIDSPTIFFSQVDQVENVEHITTVVPHISYRVGDFRSGTGYMINGISMDSSIPELYVCMGWLYPRETLFIAFLLICVSPFHV